MVLYKRYLKERPPHSILISICSCKLYAYWITVNYREAYGVYNGIYSIRSPRGETFVTREITRELANISQGLQNCLYLEIWMQCIDWGHAKDYVKMQWLMLQQEKPEDFVIATGKQYSVRDSILTAKKLGFDLEFEGEGLDEVGIVKNIESIFVKV